MPSLRDGPPGSCASCACGRHRNWERASSHHFRSQDEISQEPSRTAHRIPVFLLLRVFLLKFLKKTETNQSHSPKIYGILEGEGQR